MFVHFVIVIEVTGACLYYYFLFRYDMLTLTVSLVMYTPNSPFSELFHNLAKMIVLVVEKC